MKSPTIRLLTFAAVAVLALAGCSAPSAGAPEDPTPSGTTSPATAGEGDESPEVSDESAPDATLPAVPDDVVAPEDLPNEPVGSQISIAGDPATVCLYGDGYGTTVWAGGDDTSCAFVEAAYAAMTEGQDVEDVLHDLLITEITVTDPASGADRVLACAPRGEQLTTCVGPDGLVVHAY